MGSSAVDLGSSSTIHSYPVERLIVPKHNHLYLTSQPRTTVIKVLLEKRDQVASGGIGRSGSDRGRLQYDRSSSGKLKAKTEAGEEMCLDPSPVCRYL